MSDESDFADLKFKVECGQMTLTKAGDTPFVVQGPGEIWQDEDGVLQFKIFAAQDGYLRLMNHAMRPVTIGSIYSETDYFSLKAATHQGPVWTAERVLPDVTGGLAEGLAKGRLRGLTKPNSFPVGSETASIFLRFRGKHEFPCNQGTTIETKVGDKVRRRSRALNVAFVDDGESHFEFYHEGEHTVASLRLPLAQYHEAIADRIHEALQFVLGHQLALMCVQTRLNQRGTTQLISPDLGAGRLDPPLRFQAHDDSAGQVWRLFTLYFRHIRSRTEPDWHPMSLQIAGVVESTAASFVAQMLALGVATEGLAGECFPSLAPVPADFLAELVRMDALLDQAAKDGQLTGRTTARIKGSIGGMRRARNSDIIRAFIANHRLPAGLYDSWSKVRNTTAHGSGGGGRPIEEALKLYHETLSLFYALVLEKIGYTGPRTDYAASGFPVSQWPMPPKDVVSASK